MTFDDQISAEQTQRPDATTERLTRRELEVLTYLAHGKTCRQVGQALGIRQRTVAAHSQSAFRKLNAANTTHAVALAIHQGLIEL